MRLDLASLTTHTYRRSDVVYRISLLREFFTYVLFSAARPIADAEAIDAFVREISRPETDGIFLHSLPDELFTGISRASLDATISSLEAEAATLESVRLTTARPLRDEDLAAIGKWVRETVAPSALIDTEVDPYVITGCRFVWRDRAYDYSFSRLFEHSESQVRQAIMSRLALAAV